MKFLSPLPFIITSNVLLQFCYFLGHDSPLNSVHSSGKENVKHIWIYSRSSQSANYCVKPKAQVTTTCPNSQNHSQNHRKKVLGDDQTQPPAQHCPGHHQPLCIAKCIFEHSIMLEFFGNAEHNTSGIPAAPGSSLGITTVLLFLIWDLPPSSDHWDS